MPNQGFMRLFRKILLFGDTTHSSAAGIPDALMYHYVGCDPSNLPDTARRHHRPTLEMRLPMQRFMPHGFIDIDQFGRRNEMRVILSMIHVPEPMALVLVGHIL